MNITLKTTFPTDNLSRVRELQREIIDYNKYNREHPAHQICFGNKTNELIKLIGKEETFNFINYIMRIYER